MTRTITCLLTNSLAINFHFSDADDFCRAGESLLRSGCVDHRPIDIDDVRAIAEAVGAAFKEVPAAGEMAYSIGAPVPIISIPEANAA